MKLHIVFNNGGTPVNDKDVMAFAQTQVDRVKGTEQELQVDVGQSSVILAFKVLVKRGEINPKDILFYFKGYKTRIDKNGTFDNDYEDDTLLNLMMELI